MAATANLQIPRKDEDLVSFPVYAGETIYEGALCVVGSDGYLRNLTTSNKGGIVVVADEYLAAPTSSGSIVNGQYTNCVRCWVRGLFKFAATSVTQAMVGQPMYAVDNETVDEAQTNNAIFVGTMVAYDGSTTTAWVDLNKMYGWGGLIMERVALTAAGDGTAGAVLAWANPTGKTIMIHGFMLDITTAPTDTAGGVDAGVAANATTSADTLIDGAVLAAAGVFDMIKNAGTNGTANQKLTSSQYITVTSVVGSHLDLAAMVGTALIVYSIFQ